MTPLILTLLTFGAGALAVAGVYSVMSDLFLRERSHVQQRVDEEFKQRSRVQKSRIVKEQAKVKPDAFGVEKIVASVTLRERFETMVEQSGLNLTGQKLLAIAATSGVGVALLIGLWKGVFAAAVAGAIAAALPVWVVRMKQKRRLDQLLSQLPDAFDLMARIIRAGQTMSQAFQGVADEFQAPVATEFAYCYEQQNLGLSPDLALRDLARRTGLVEMRIFVMAVLVQRQTGGNLAELLEKLATVVRERFRIRGKIKSLTAEGRLEAAVLLALPPLTFLAIFYLNPTYAQGLLDHPNLIVAMVTIMGVGALWIRKIINFDF